MSGKLDGWTKGSLQQGKDRSRVLITLLFLGLASLTVALWLIAAGISQRVLEEQTAVVGDQVAARISQCVNYRIDVIATLAPEWRRTEEIFHETLDLRIADVLEAFPGYQAINFINADGIIRDVHPLIGNEAALGKDVDSHPVAWPYIEKARQTGTLAITEPLVLFQGGEGFAFYLPSFDDQGRLTGFFNGVFRNRRLMRSCLGSESVEGFSLHLSDAGALVYESLQASSVGSSAVLRKITIGDRQWSLRVEPSVALASQILTLPKIILYSGLLLSIVITGIAIAGSRIRARSNRDVRSSRAATHRLASVVAGSRDVVAMFDVGGEMRYLNPIGKHLCGITSLEASSFGDLVYPSDLGLANEHLEALRREGTAQIELRFAGPDGEGVPAELSSFVVSDPLTGEPAVLATIARDLRERRRLELELLQARKMEALGRLAGGVAHDFNNILTVILANASLLEPLCVKADDLELLREMESACDRAARLTGQLMSLGRGRSSSLEPIDLTVLIDGMEGLIKRLGREDIELVVDLNREGAMIFGNRVQLEQIVLNLVINAFEASASGGRVRIAVHRRAGNLLLEVEDSGQGMSAEVAERVFEPFFTTKDPGKGTGLGLATVYGHVKQLGGEIEVKSVLGLGSCFCVSFPLLEEIPEPCEETPLSIGQLGQLTGKVVLLAEDSPEVRSTTARILRGAGFEVIEAKHGNRAKALLAGGLRCDVVLSDVVMPGTGGVALAEWISSERPELPIVLFSGYVDDELEGFDFDLVEAVLAKPFEPEALVETLNRAILLSTRPR